MLALFGVVACTAAAGDASGPETSADAVSGTTTPDAAAPNVATAALPACGVASIGVPKSLPDPTGCINDEVGGGGPDTTCNGWTKLGPFVKGTEHLYSYETRGAQMYKIEPNDRTLCLLLMRGDRTTSDGSLNGLHCYDKQTCDVCGWDGRTSEGKKPTTDVMKHSSADGSDCSDCHRAGPLLPKAALWEGASDETKVLNQTCVANGGPRWADAPGIWEKAKPNVATIVPAPRGCANKSCHGAGFVKAPKTCSFLKLTFADENGSMRANGKKFAGREACETFRADMGCSETDLDCGSSTIVDVAP